VTLTANLKKIPFADFDVVLEVANFSHIASATVMSYDWHDQERKGLEPELPHVARPQLLPRRPQGTFSRVYNLFNQRRHLASSFIFWF